ncbi:MAG: TIGR00730 family Rossman fold protein [Ideonella sp.]|nr:TIGR00730 family Rossman fold protein [Ideonella sp.]MCC7457999.1 TIGR00730 family Rossman fold protein [Nitrospira sp.]
MALSFKLCVYCGSRPGVDPAYRQAARELGQAIGRRGWRMVYGGGGVGLMGAVADAALAAGALVTGVIPESLMRREVGHAGLTELRVVQTMHERKRLMAEGSDAFVALPGGIGTLEELFEVWSWRHLGYHDQPVGLLDTAGYFQPLAAMLRHAADAGFVTAEQIAMITLDARVESLLDRLAAEAVHATAVDDLRRI